MSDSEDFTDQNNGVISNLKEFIRQECESKGLNAEVEVYTEEREKFNTEVDVIAVTTWVDGEKFGMEITIEDPDAPQNIYLAQAEHMLKTLRREAMDSATYAPTE